MTGGIVLGIRLRFHHHTPEQAAVCLVFHQPAANHRRGDDLRWTAEEGVGKGRESVGGYGSGFWDKSLSESTEPTTDDTFQYPKAIMR